MSSIINSTTTSPGGLISTGDSSNSLLIQTGDTTAITINSSQAVSFTNALGAASGGTGLSSPGTAGNVLTSNGTAWTSAAAAGFPSGTVMLFAQTSAPTGWTKNTSTGDNSALRVVTGSASTGGSVAFTTAFASQTPAGSINTSGLSAGATTLNTTQIPSHTHTQIATGTLGPYGNPGCGSVTLATGGSANTGSTGGGGSHTHTVSGSATFTGTAINLAVQYIDVIRATKD